MTMIIKITTTPTIINIHTGMDEFVLAPVVVVLDELVIGVVAAVEIVVVNCATVVVVVGVVVGVVVVAVVVVGAAVTATLP